MVLYKVDYTVERIAVVYKVNNKTGRIASV